MQIHNEIPKEVLSCKTTELYKYVEDLSLFHLKGKEANPLFISTLLHGNETTGFYGLQSLLNNLDLTQAIALLTPFGRQVSEHRRGVQEDASHHKTPKFKSLSTYPVKLAKPYNHTQGRPPEACILLMAKAPR